MFVFLLESILITFLMGLVPPLRVMWVATAALGGLLLAYVWLLLWIKARGSDIHYWGGRPGIGRQIVAAGRARAASCSRTFDCRFSRGMCAGRDANWPIVTLSVRASNISGQYRGLSSSKLLRAVVNTGIAGSNPARRKPLVAGNWKLHKTIAESVQLAQQVAALVQRHPGRRAQRQRRRR